MVLNYIAFFCSFKLLKALCNVASSTHSHTLTTELWIIPVGMWKDKNLHIIVKGKLYNNSKIWLQMHFITITYYYLLCPVISYFLLLHYLTCSFLESICMLYVSWCCYFLLWNNKTWTFCLSGQCIVSCFQIETRVGMHLWQEINKFIFSLDCCDLCQISSLRRSSPPSYTGSNHIIKHCGF